MKRWQLALMVLLLGVPGILFAQEDPRCFEFESLDGEWISYDGAGPSHDFDATTPFLQIPRRFTVSDSSAQPERRATKPLPGANSVFPNSSWRETSDGIVLGWSAVDVGWVARLTPVEGTVPTTWRGTVQRGGTSGADGRWAYQVLLRSIACPTA